MSFVQRRTLGELRYDLAVRLGYGAQGTVSALQRPILDNFLQDAQRQLARRETDVLLSKRINDEGQFHCGQILYDIPDDCDPLQLTYMGIRVNDAYLPLKYGIDERRNYETEARPFFYEIRHGTTDQPQIEVWPEPNEEAKYRIAYQPVLVKFVNNDDKASIDDHVIFLLALANAKAHYQQPDAGAISNELDQYLRQLKYRQHSNRSYRFGDQAYTDLDGVHLFEEG